MSFDDFHHDHKRHGHSPYEKYDSEQFPRFDWSGNKHSNHWIDLYNKIRSNPKLRILCIGVIAFVLLLIFGMIALFFPLIIKLMNYISEYGIEGVVKMIADLQEKLWHGNK